MKQVSSSLPSAAQNGGRRVILDNPWDAFGALCARGLAGVGLASALCGIPRRRLMRWIDRGRVTQYRILGGILVDVFEVRRLAAQNGGQDVEGQGVILPSDASVCSDAIS